MSVLKRLTSALHQSAPVVLLFRTRYTRPAFQQAPRGPTSTRYCVAAAEERFVDASADLRNRFGLGCEQHPQPYLISGPLRRRVVRRQRAGRLMVGRPAQGLRDRGAGRLLILIVAHRQHCVVSKDLSHNSIMLPDDGLRFSGNPAVG